MTDRAAVVRKYQAPYDVYVGRPTKWGNPFVIGQDGDRAAACFPSGRRKHERH